MTANDILINVGNTHTQIAPLVAGLPGEIATVSTEDFLASGHPWLGNPGGGIVFTIACVVPAVREALVGSYGTGTCRFIAPELVSGVDFELVDTSTVGDDRLANIAGALTVATPPFVVLDCGTAITTEAVDGDRVFRGGAILPGRHLLRRSLHSGTAQLPDIPIGDTVPGALGRTTVDAIRAGVDLGVVGAVSRLLAASLDELGVDACPVLAIGGDATYFASHVPGVRLGPRDLTLRGLAAVACD